MATTMMEKITESKKDFFENCKPNSCELVMNFKVCFLSAAERKIIFVTFEKIVAAELRNIAST